MVVHITYKNDAFFKYTVGTNDKDSKKIRRFIIQFLLEKRLHFIDCTNPEIVPEMIRDKSIILDTFIERKDMIIDIEMQNTPLNRFQYQRFQYYHSRLITKQLERGDDYNKIKDVYQIIFVDDTDQNQLVSTYVLKENTPISHHLIHMIIVNIPYIESIINHKKKLNAFEAMICLFHRQSLEGIKYEDKGGIIKMIKEKYHYFVREPELAESAKYREYQRINYEAMKESEIEEAKKQQKEISLKEGIDKGIIYVARNIMLAQ